jgi:hypothetical protein
VIITVFMRKLLFGCGFYIDGGRRIFYNVKSLFVYRKS